MSVPIHELAPITPRPALELVQVLPETVIEQTPDELAAEALAKIHEAGAQLTRTIAEHPIVNPEQDHTKMAYTKEDATLYRTPSGWHPGQVHKYKSFDPFQAANPEVTEAVNALHEVGIAQVHKMKETENPTLTYLNAQRSRGGKKRTPVTQAYADLDPGMSDWMDALPRAENLRVVAHPETTSDTIAVDRETNEIVAIPNTEMMSAIFIGSIDGRAVREREAWERDAVDGLIDAGSLPDKTLTITSLGTGTGEPAMDTGIALVAKEFGSEGRVVVNGYDQDDNSLRVAKYLADKKCVQAGNQDWVQFNALQANLLTAEGIEAAVAGTPADAYESIGFMEYVPSDHADSPIEQQQRRLMEKIGSMSAEDFYATIYEHMPVGSVFLTGNMRNDNPQSEFVTDCMGWKGIIQRGTTEYMQIIERAGIPGEAVNLFVPDMDNSAAVYNLVAIRKI